MINIYHNKEAFLRKTPHHIFILSIILFLIFIIIILLASNIEIYDHYLTKGYVSCEENCTIKVVIPTTIDYKLVKLNDKNWHYQLLTKEIIINNEDMNSYYDLTFENNLNLLDNEIVNLSFYYNKQSILHKLKTLMF